MYRISPNTKIKDVRFCAIDLETTGANPFCHKIIEVGISAFSLDKDYERFQTFCDPQMHIPENTVAIHGITDEMVAGSPVFSAVKADVFSFIGDSALIAHNPCFDLAFLNLAEYQLGFRVLDTVRLSRLVFPDSPNHKLGTLCSYLGIELCHHRALADAVGCMEVFRSIIAKIDPRGECTVGSLLSLHGELISSPISEKKTNSSGGPRGMKIGKRVKITYRDFDKTVAEHEIVPQKFLIYGKKEYMLAQCSRNKGESFFCINRIVSVS